RWKLPRPLHGHAPIEFGHIVRLASFMTLPQTPVNLNPDETPPGSNLSDFSSTSGVPGPDVEPQHNSPAVNETTEPVKAERPFSVYTKREKWYMVGMAALAGIFSPLASTVYFPAIPTMAAAFGKTIELINLTVTMYMIFQGISPMLWGSLADRFGRRPVYLTCLSLLLLSCVGLALVPINAYWLLMVLRCFQAAGSASMVALGAGVISDIATPAERGGFMGLFALGPTLGPCIGPIIGGLLSGGLGWRCVDSSASDAFARFVSHPLGLVSKVHVLVLDNCYRPHANFYGTVSEYILVDSVLGWLISHIIRTYPETLRAIVGDGSKPPQKWNRTPIPILGRRVPRISADSDFPTRTVPRKGANPLRIFRVFTQPDVLLVLVSTGIIYSLFYSVTTSTSPLFLSAYPYLTQSTVGLCFIAYGAGCALGSIVMGKVLDYDWRKMEGNLISSTVSTSHQVESGENSAEKGAHTTTHGRDSRKEKQTPAKPDKQDLPIEHTRLKRVPILFVIELGACIGYGWSVQQKAHIAVPLVLQFIGESSWYSSTLVSPFYLRDIAVVPILVGLVSMAFMTVTQTILVDMYPAQGSSITASNNFVRCLLGAGTVSIQDFIINAINPGWTYVLFCGICLLTVPLFIIEWRYGAIWRGRRIPTG
ncbi:unnamed protein product, partial [Rhizoctonia solani]